VDPLLLPEAWITALFIGLLMAAACEAGFRFGERRGAAATHVDNAVLALLGLLLAFSFSHAADKHDRRQWEAVAEATAVGDLAGVASVLAEPERGELLLQLRGYVDLRLEHTAATGDDKPADALFERNEAILREMTATTARAVERQNTPSVHNVLVATLNSVSTTFERRRSARRDHLPVTVLSMLLVSTLMGAYVLGRMQRASGGRQPLPTALFIGLVSVVVFVIIDLEQPRRGVVRVWEAPFVELRDSLRE
jgi:hypothetical protein